MKTARITRAGARRAPAKTCSRSRSRPSRPGRRASGTATTTETGTAEAAGLARSAIRLLVLRVVHDPASLPADTVEAARRPPRHVGMVHGHGDLGELPLGHEVDARPVDRG